jgi:hypothetical protein
MLPELVHGAFQQERVVTKIGFFAENGLFAPGSSVKNIRTQNKGLFVVSKKLRYFQKIKIKSMDCCFYLSGTSIY